jgi:OmpA-OmpF porin, OOP family
MLKKTILIIIIQLLLPLVCFSQLAKNSWNFGFGFSYPRFLTTNLLPDEGGYGGFLSMQRNFSEHIGFRALGNILHLEGEYQNLTQQTRIIAGNFDLLYYLIPCEPVSPYLLFGFGAIHYKFDKKLTPDVVDNSFIDYQINFGLGAEWDIGAGWHLKTELDYHTAANSNLDGIYGTNGNDGILGSENDTYMRFDIGLVYYFSKGEPSNLCNIYSGISAPNTEIDYNRIDSIVKKYQVKPSEEIDYNKIEALLNKYQNKITPTRDGWILVGVNFDFNSANIKPESFPNLFHSLKVLLENPELKIEIQGYTDNLGSGEKNQKLSLNRAVAIMNYLISKGVSKDRLTAIGLGSQNPVADNNTEEGRALNRRIEFKIIKN